MASADLIDIKKWINAAPNYTRRIIVTKIGEHFGSRLGLSSVSRLYFMAERSSPDE
ncbi:MAG: hypothetical protein ACXV6K_02865 [Halobacteriota archaeon]